MIAERQKQQAASTREGLVKCRPLWQNTGSAGMGAESKWLVWRACKSPRAMRAAAICRRAATQMMMASWRSTFVT